ncbi:zinc finger protein RFP-like [Trachemys scripta elegans]|uniref:zinc finger protein RFP-like n=1 Tax=Trachemys scripta elegans TaxID=31138 RepID=UPI0015545DA3|nr:zinc finger protein RFP-like [Trachemys scripta elegans]
MASSLSGLDMQEEVICPICLEYLTDPVSVDCGHNFCRGCVTQYCVEWAGRGSLMCPVCRSQILTGNLRPNWQLGNLVEKMKHVAVCARHKKTLDLFCEDDGEAVCVVCERSPQHRSHTVLLIEEAAQKYKEKIQDHLKTLREEREKLLGFKVTGEGKSREYLKQTQTERQKIVSEFQQLRQFLEEQERLLLAQLEKLDEEIVKIQKENVTKLSEEISRLSELIREMEGKCQKPASEFLQDVRSTLSRCEKWKFQQPVEISPELEKRLSVLSHKNVALMETLRQFKDTLPSELERKGWKCLGSQREDTLPSELEQGGGKYLGSHANVNVTLDPDTAHPQLVLSEDGKTVRYGCLWNKLPNMTKRFDYERCVLGSEGFTSGRHCWEVEAGERGGWAIGVARESLGRKGEITFNPEAGIWAMEYWEGQYWALTDPLTPLPLSRVPRRIWVYLDYKQGQVAFFNADNESSIFTFPPASFAGERIRPLFVVWETESQLRLCP